MKCIAVVALFGLFAVALASEKPAEDLQAAESAVFYNAPAAVYPYPYAGYAAPAYRYAAAPAYRYAAAPTYAAAVPHSVASQYAGVYNEGAYVPGYFGPYNGFV